MLGKKNQLWFIKFKPLFAVIVVLGTSVSTSLWGQTHSERVTIFSSFQPSLQEFSKINIKPEPPTTYFETLETEFPSVEKVMSTSAELELISPLLARTKDNQNEYRNYVKAGLGSFISPFFFFMHHSNLSKETSLDLSIQHLSSWIKVKDYAPSDWMQNAFSLGLNHAFSNHSLRSDLYYKYNSNRYYGFKPDDFPENDFIKSDLAQSYQNIGFSTVLKSNYKDVNMLHHEISLKYNYLTDHFTAREHSFNLKGDLQKNFDWFRYDGNQTTGIEINTGYYANNDSVSKSTDFLLGLMPTLRLSGSFYEINAGLRLNYLNDSSAHFYAYPVLSGKLFMFDQRVEMYALMDGDLNRQSLYQMTDYNPFLRSGEAAYWSNTRFLFKTGIKTGIIKNLDLHFGLQFNEIDNAGFYITDTTTPFQNTLKVVNDNVNLLTFVGELSYKLSNKFMIASKLQVDKYEPTTLTRAWHTPSFQMNLRANYQFDEKLRFLSEMIFQGHRYAPYYMGGIEKIMDLKPVADINIGSEYAISEQFTVFVQINNLLHNKYERYYNYPVQGIQLFAGMSLKF